MIFRCLIVPLVAVAFHAGPAFAQDTPAQATGQGERDACMKEFVPLRKEAQERGRLIRNASARHAPGSETCLLIRNFGESEIEMIRYVEANTTRCEIPSHVADQLKAGHDNTEEVLTKLCMPVSGFGDIGALPLVR